MYRCACDGDFGQLVELHHTSPHVLVESTAFNVMSFASQNGHLDIVRWFLDTFGKENGAVDTCSAIMYAARGGQLHVMKWVLERDPLCLCQAAMTNAAQGGHVAAMEWLVGVRCPTHWESCIEHAKDDEARAWLRANRDDSLPTT